jgi:hypothetical protein
MARVSYQIASVAEHLLRVIKQPGSTLCAESDKYRASINKRPTTSGGLLIRPHTIEFVTRQCQQISRAN